MKIKFTPYEMRVLRSTAISLYLEGYENAYDPEVQHAICIIKALEGELRKRGLDVSFNWKQIEECTPTDDL